jgi:hypothetical protein
LAIRPEKVFHSILDSVLIVIGGLDLCQWRAEVPNFQFVGFA